MDEGKVFLSQIKTLINLVSKNSNVIWSSGIYFEEKGEYMMICVPFIREGELWEFVISGPDGGYTEYKFEGVLSIDG